MKLVVQVLLSILTAISIYFYLHKDHDIRKLTKLGYLTHYIGQHNPQVSRIEIKIQNLPKNLKNKKIIQISDLHHEDGYTLTDSTLNETLKIINDENPDLILITGDFIDMGSPNTAKEIGSKLKNLKNVYAITGDHDCFVDRNLVVREIESESEIKFLDNRILENVIPGLTLIGFGNLRSGLFKPEQTFRTEIKDKENVIIAMSHNPDTAKCLLKDHTCNSNVHIDLLLSGHTHGGQVGFPFGFNWLLFVKDNFHAFLDFIAKVSGHSPDVIENYNWMFGKFEFENKNKKSTLYVNRGIGSHKALRILCKPEIAVFTLVD
jgi:uncharacterized protein